MERVGSWLGNNGILTNLAVTHTPAAPSRLFMPPITPYIDNREIGNITRNR